VDERHLSAGETAYAAKEWQQAALEFMAAVHGSPAEGVGHALHMAGNALVKLGRYADAATVYRKAAGDTTYDKRGTVFSNLGAALVAAGKPEEAVDAYDAALADAAYATPYKALLGKAGALYGTGRFEDATRFYRQAAWADGNPDPGKALNNLGLSFMALGRPEDAVEAFRAALGVEDYASKGKASANLGLAYAAMGFFEESAREFETARDVYGHELTGPTLEAYESALNKARVEQTGEIVMPLEDLKIQTVEGWETGELVTTPVSAPSPSPEATGPIDLLPEDGEQATKRFFEITEGEMKVADREARKAERAAKRTPQGMALRVGLVLLAVLVVVGGLAGAFFLGYGYPTQEQTVTSLLNAYKSGGTYTDFWVAVPPTDVKQAMRALPAKFASFRIEGVDRTAQKSTVLVRVVLDSGSNLSYTVQLAREGVGWKVVGVANRWVSGPS
jgi:tetratricopeptide (TPR) repeat protein